MNALIKEISENSIIVEINDRLFSLPSKTYHNYNLVSGDTVCGKVKFDFKKQKEYFEPNHPIYSIETEYDFDIIEIIDKNGKNIIIVSDCFDNKIYVYGFKWQRKGLFEKPKLKCLVTDFNFGRPVLKNVDFFHPIYEVGKTYSFKFKGIETKTLENGNNMDVIKLLGDDNCIHETPPLPSQCGHKFKPVSLKCKIVSIGTYIKLEQVDFTDPYFSRIESILSIDNSLINKYFYNLREKDKSEPNIHELFKQYDSNSSLWTITYCNKVLPEIIINLANNFNLKEAINVIEICTQIENWILNSGFLDSFKKESTRINIQKKSESYLDKFSQMQKAFSFIISNSINIDTEDHFNNNIVLLGYYLKYNKPELIDIKSVVNSFIKLLTSPGPSNIDISKVKSVIVYIEYQKIKIKKDDLETDFTIGKFQSIPFSSQENLNLFINLLIIQIYLLDFIGEFNRKYQYISELLKYLSLVFTEESEKRLCLKYSFFLSNYKGENLALETISSLFFSDHRHIFNSLISSFKLPSISVKDDIWKSVVKIKNSDEAIIIKLLRKERFGFIGNYNGINCIISKNNLNSAFLKEFPESECEIELSVKIIEVFNNFNTILVKELDHSDAKYLCRNLHAIEVKIGDIIVGKVKSITSYGIFVSTLAGEGLIHLINVSDLFIDIPLSNLFEVGEELRVCIIGKTEENKLKLGIKQLAGTKFENELREIEFKILAPELFEVEKKEKSIIRSKTETNKRIFNQGQVFEYFSNIQYDFEGKIKYLKLAKVFYSGVQSSRSYFLNIYISYFDILLEIENVLYEKSDDRIKNIPLKSTELLVQLRRNTESIEKFPSIHRLIFFVEILSQFNLVTKDSFFVLSNYIFGQDFQKQRVLIRVAKVVLSNNLILSEKIDSDFSFKNLRIVFQYLKEGVFDITDSEIERKERELKERISNIRNKILNEESEKVEFKSTLLKPIPDAKNIRKISSLQKCNSLASRKELDSLTGKGAQKRIIHSAMKTLVAFANSKGGTLFIGINDEGEFLGLQNDYDEIGLKSRDELGKKLDEIINDYIGNSFFGLLSIQFEAIEKKDILIITVKESNEEVFLVRNEDGNKCSDFFIRRHSSSVRLDGKELIDYYKWKYNKPSA